MDPVAHRFSTSVQVTRTTAFSLSCELPNMADYGCETGDDGRPTCSQCERTGQKCHRTKDKRSFRVGSSAQYEKKFSKDQVWLNFTKNGRPCHESLSKRSAPKAAHKLRRISFVSLRITYQLDLSSPRVCFGPIGP